MIFKHSSGWKSASMPQSWTSWKLQTVRISLGSFSSSMIFELTQPNSDKIPFMSFQKCPHLTRYLLDSLRPLNPSLVHLKNPLWLLFSLLKEAQKACDHVFFHFQKFFPEASQFELFNLTQRKERLCSIGLVSRVSSKQIPMSNVKKEGGKQRNYSLHSQFKNILSQKDRFLLWSFMKTFNFYAQSCCGPKNIQRRFGWT